MDNDSKNRMIQPLCNYMSNVDAIREALEKVPQAAEARRLLLLAKLDMLNAIHEIKLIDQKGSIDNNPSAYLIDIEI